MEYATIEVRLGAREGEELPEPVQAKIQVPGIAQALEDLLITEYEGSEKLIERLLVYVWNGFVTDAAKELQNLLTGKGNPKRAVGPEQAVKLMRTWQPGVDTIAREIERDRAVRRAAQAAKLRAKLAALEGRGAVVVESPKVEPTEEVSETDCAS